MTRRLLIAARREGRSTIVSDAPAPLTHFAATPGFAADLLWQTPPAPTFDHSERVNATKPPSVLPDAGGTSLFLVTFPPDAVMAEPGFDPEAAGAEYARLLPGLAELFERDNPGMHRSNTIDYDIVLEGRVIVEFDDGETVALERGDILVQHGTRHAWRNPGSEPATMLFVLIGAAPE